MGVVWVGFLPTLFAFGVCQYSHHPLSFLALLCTLKPGPFPLGDSLVLPFPGTGIVPREGLYQDYWRMQGCWEEMYKQVSSQQLP